VMILRVRRCVFNAPFFQSVKRDGLPRQARDECKKR
jgi:hypothetical protein